jgi:HlyD family secretion protein
MKRKATFAALALLVLALLVWAFMPTPAPVEIATVTEGRFERSVNENGKTRLRERFVVSTPLAGRIARIHLKQGDAVVMDDTLATMWPVVPGLLDERYRAEQYARIKAMQATLAKTNANLQRAEAALDQSRADFKRSETLLQQGFVSPNQHEADRLNVRLREKELESAWHERSAASYEMEQSQLALKQFSQNTSNGKQPTFSIKAPVTGNVLRVMQQSEGILAAGTPLLELGDPTQLEVVVDILTEDAAQIKPGTLVQLSNWGGPTLLAGRVKLVEPAAFTKVSALGVEEQRVNAIVEITSPAETWRALGDGFKVDVRLLVQVMDNAIKVPISALFPLGAKSALFELKFGRARLREIEVTARNGEEAWVKSGLTVGTQVITYPDNKLRDGTRVKAREIKIR